MNDNDALTEMLEAAAAGREPIGDPPPDDVPGDDDEDDDDDE